jgi:hypothetical protein
VENFNNFRAQTKLSKFKNFSLNLCIQKCYRYLQNCWNLYYSETKFFHCRSFLKICSKFILYTTTITNETETSHVKLFYGKCLIILHRIKISSLALANVIRHPTVAPSYRWWRHSSFANSKCHLLMIFVGLFRSNGTISRFHLPATFRISLNRDCCCHIHVYLRGGQRRIVASEAISRLQGP